MVPEIIFLAINNDRLSASIDTEQRPLTIEGVFRNGAASFPFRVNGSRNRY